jgi:dipeptide transport system ATP-binding protein
VKARSMAFAGRDLATISDRTRRALVGKDIAMIFQDPLASLNPCFTVAFQLMETLRIHGTDDERRHRAVRRARALSLLEQVEIPDAAARLDAFPHQLSGGMAQRVMIAMAIACNPRLLIADEPTTALDVTVQAQVLALLTRLQRERNMALILMYAGQEVETGPVPGVFETPRHPYTQALLAALPEHNEDNERLKSIPGMVPGQHDRPTGCLLSPRCAYAVERCRRDMPALTGGTARGARCHFPLDAGGRPTGGWKPEAVDAESLV